MLITGEASHYADQQSQAGTEAVAQAEVKFNGRWHFYACR